MGSTETVRCGLCLGMGYRGAWVAGRRRALRLWRILTCRGCRGTGLRPAFVRQRGRQQRRPYTPSDPFRRERGE